MKILFLWEASYLLDAQMKKSGLTIRTQCFEPDWLRNLRWFRYLLVIHRFLAGFIIFFNSRTIPKRWKLYLQGRDTKSRTWLGAPNHEGNSIKRERPKRKWRKYDSDRVKSCIIYRFWRLFIFVSPLQTLRCVKMTRPGVGTQNLERHWSHSVAKAIPYKRWRASWKMNESRTLISKSFPDPRPAFLFI